MKYKEWQHSSFSACGLNCGLCPRYHTVGASRCPGCAGKGFLEKHPTCGILSCCQRRGIEYCYHNISTLYYNFIQKSRVKI